MKPVFRLRLVFLLSLLACRAAVADSDEELQKKLANPVADLVTLPFQYTGTAGVGPLDKWQHGLNIQPVYPVKLGDWTLINRAIVPILSNPSFAPGGSRKTGLSDITYEGFFSPAPSGGLIWGVGPAVMLRTATDALLGTGKWSAGPAVVALLQPGKWTVGALVTQLWSFAGDSARTGVSQMQFQPILSYRLSPTDSIGYLGTITANWKGGSGNRWTVPVGLTYSILTKPPGSVPINYIFGGGYNVASPRGAGGGAVVRLQVNFILPK